MKRIALLALSTLLGFSAIAAPVAPSPGNIRWRDNMFNARYGEIVVVDGPIFNMKGHVYNTLGLNDCPEAVWSKLNAKTLSRQLHAHFVLLNGPRYFLMDKASLKNPGAVTTFDGLQARYLANVDISFFSMLRGHGKPFTENIVARTTTYVFNQGRTIYKLTAPDGRTYVMQSYSRIVDPKLSEPDLRGLGSRLKLPKGWHYNVETLKKPLILNAAGTAYVLQDNFMNSYQRVTP